MSIRWAVDKPGFKYLLLLTAVICALASPVVSAEHEGERVNRVKAAFVLNVARFVTWPAEVLDVDNKHMMLCYYRSKPFAQGLDSIKGKTVGGRPLAFMQVEHLSAAADCHILLISPKELDQFAEDVGEKLTQPLLTVADQTHNVPGTALPKGVLVSLVRKGASIGFHVDLSTSRSVGLKMSSQMLKHAHIVNGADE